MSLLIQEPPLQVLPSLAVKIGLNEAMFLQQVHYWLQRSGKTINGHKWIYNTVADWQKQFPFWSARTIQGIVYSLKDKGLLVTDQLSNDKRDKTNYYRIAYANALLHDANIACPDDANFAPSMTQDLRDVHTENTTETNSNKKYTGELAMLMALDGMDEQVALDWLKVRKAKRAPLTATALNRLVAEADKAGVKPSEAIRMAAEKGWQGFSADWLTSKKANQVIDPHVVIDLFNRILPELTPVDGTSDKREAMIARTIEKRPRYANPETWELYFQHVRTQDRLMGWSRSPWKATFDWLINHDNLITVVEGQHS